MSETFRLRDLLGSLVELERAGQRLYGALAEVHSATPELKALFTELASWERRHEKLYMDLLARCAADDDGAEVIDSEYAGYLKSLVQSAMHVANLSGQTAEGMTEAFQLALQLEKDTVLFLHEVIPHISPAYASKDIFATVLREEQRHVSIIQSRLNEEGN